MTWGTTEGFLDHFGLESLESLPGQEELKAAGLLDARPAIAALGARGLLPGEDMGPEEEDELDEEEASDVLHAEFAGVAAEDEDGGPDGDGAELGPENQARARSGDHTDGGDSRITRLRPGEPGT